MRQIRCDILRDRGAVRLCGRQLHRIRNDLNRKDVHHLWEFETGGKVRVVAGFRTASKKSGRLRKVFVQCSANHVFCDVWPRASQGMLGGSALGTLHSPNDEITVASLDE